VVLPIRILDLVFREDDSRIRKGHAPENFAMLRHIALNLLKSAVDHWARSAYLQRLS
jgi:predicted transposase YbfD/YdcC